MVPDHRKFPGVLLALAAGFAASSSAPTPAIDPAASGEGATEIASAHVPGEILVKFRERAVMADHARARAGVAARLLKTFRSGAEHWQTGGGMTTEEAIARLLGDPD